jgi:heterodisulfide reductase subunit B
MPGSGCCGTSYLETLDKKTALAMAARNIAIAESMGLNIVTLCNGCTETLTKANLALKEDPKLRSEVNDILAEAGREFRGTSDVKHLARVFKEDIGVERIKAATIQPYKGLKVGTHHGCHLLRPSEIMRFEDVNDPKVLDDLVTAVGAEPVDYPGKLDCCAGPVMGIRENVTWEVGLDKVNEVKKRADALLTCCPFCYLTFERCQLMSDENPGLPVVHFTQLLGLAMGLTQEEVGLSDNKIDSEVLMERQGK